MVDGRAGLLFGEFMASPCRGRTHVQGCRETPPSESGAVLPLMPPMGLLGLLGRQEAMTLLVVVSLMLAMVTVSPLTPIVALGLLVATKNAPAVMARALSSGDGHSVTKSNYAADPSESDLPPRVATASRRYTSSPVARPAPQPHER